MSDFRHIILEGKATEVDFNSLQGRGGLIPRPEDIVAHVERLRNGYFSAITQFRELQRALPPNVSPTNGAYVNLEVNSKTSPAVWKSIDTKRGAQVLNVKQQEESDLATLFVETGKENWLNDKLSAYIEGETDGKRKNERLVNAIQSATPASLASFFMNPEEYEHLSPEICEYEIWLAGTGTNTDEVKDSLAALNIICCNSVLAFNGITILLVKANKQQLEQMILCVPYLSEVRKYKRASILTRPRNTFDEREWVEIIQDNMPIAEGELSKIGILDSGVNRNHSLLSKYLPEERCHTALSSTDLRDVADHGTGMAGLVVYGDLLNVIHDVKIDTITNELVSVKIAQSAHVIGVTDEHVAVVIEDAVRQSEEDQAYIHTMAVTTGELNEPVASATSATIDETLYNNGIPQSVLFVAAGNVYENQGLCYPDYLYISPILDPAQAWNAISVGAYTEKTVIADSDYNGRKIVAPFGGVSPYSRNSQLWGQNVLIKPEILMEGGNAYWVDQGQYSTCDDLMLVTTGAHTDIRMFESFNATSAATALAARLAGAIKYQNPNLSALSIRALMIHSASWTDEMLEMCKNAEGEIDKDLLLHTCGYGIPDWNKAIATHESNVTFIAEEELFPFALSTGSELKHAHMHLFRLPWPKELLLSLGEAKVRMKVTLSYYIEPSPGIRGKLSKYTYPSELLRFDVITETETEEDFKKRVGHTKREGETGPKNDTNRWFIGITRRNQGSVVSDFIEKNAAQIAACSTIAVYPATGWWKTRKQKLDCGIKYSLVVSIETEGVDLYTPIASIINVPVISG